MKTFEKNSCYIRVVVRLGVVILVAMVGLALATEGVKNSRDYSLVSKPRSKPREIRGYRPQYLSSAIGFGKRTSDFQPLNSYERESTMLLPAKDDSQRLTNDWFIKFLMKNPELASRVERKLLYGDETARPSGTHRFKEDSDEVTYYFNE